jgi:hypothetical protein
MIMLKQKHDAGQMGGFVHDGFWIEGKRKMILYMDVDGLIPSALEADCTLSYAASLQQLILVIWMIFYQFFTVGGYLEPDAVKYIQFKTVN